MEIKNPRNSICTDCLLLGKNCTGTSNMVWTGCSCRKRKVSEFEAFREEYFAKMRSVRKEKSV